MNTGPKAASAFNQNKEDNDSHPALFFLVQEVSKLASPTSNTNPPSKLLSLASTNNHHITKNVEGFDSSFQASCSSCQHSLSCAMTYSQLKSMRDDGHSGTAGGSEEQRCKSNSPWKALSLINLHCERLLHQRDIEKLGYSTTTLPSPAPGVPEGGVESTSRPCPHLCKKQEIPACLSPVDDVRGSFSEGGYKQEGCLKVPGGGGKEQLKTSEKADSVREFQEDDKTASPQKVEFGVCSVSLPGNVLQQTHNPDACLNTELTFNSNDNVCEDAWKPALTLDHNANSLPSCNAQSPPPSTDLLSLRSASLLFHNAESSPSRSENKPAASKADCTPTQVADKCPPVAQLKSSICCVSSAISEPELCTIKKEETELPPTRQWRTRTPRKQAHPCRSVDIEESDFQGVAFRMEAQLDDTKEQCRLLITSKYSKGLWKSARKPRLRTRMLQKSLKTSSSDDEGDLTTNALKGKVCASCCTRKTPMWRDAEDGTPLCNACGIRYKKYRVRCVSCWHIPRKEGNSNSRCLKCGNFVRLTSAQRKHTS